MIDSHHHFWRYVPQEFPWITPDMTPLRKDFGPAEFEETCARNNVLGAISVQARTTLDETAELLAIADKDPRILGVVGWVDLKAPDVASQLVRFRSSPKFVGVREICQGAEDGEFFDNPNFNRGVRELTTRNLAYDILVHGRQLPAAIRFVDRHPAQRFVLDHCGKPSITSAGIDADWRTNIREMARRENVFCKLSGLTTEVVAPLSATFEVVRPYLEIAIDAFGPSRTMFGSDWPVCLLQTSYDQWCNDVALAIEKLGADEQRLIGSLSALAGYAITNAS